MSFRCPLFKIAIWFYSSLGVIAAPDWTINPAALGSADLEGRLAIALPMGPAAGSAPEFGLQLQLIHTVSEVKLKTSQRDERVDLLRKAAKLSSIGRPKGVPLPVDPRVTMIVRFGSCPSISFATDEGFGVSYSCKDIHDN